MLLLTLVLLTAGSWAITVHQARTMDMPMGVAISGTAHASMDGMGATATAGWSVGAAAAFLAVWTVMMAAMMLPAAAPMVLLFDAVHAKRRGQPSFIPTWIFVAGYLLVWTAAGLIVYALVRLGSDLADRLGAADREAWAPRALGTILVAAGLYQLTPLKRVCLNHCRSALGFVMTHWRDGRLGTLRMGLEHGAYCLGCCWALFAVLVATGVMSLPWMILLTLVVFAEKVFPHERRVTVGIGAGFVVLGVIVAAGTMDLPWAV